MNPMMNFRFDVILVLLCSSVFFCQCNKDNTNQLDNLLFSEEFDTDGPIDESVWNYDIGTGIESSGEGWGNNELQYYTDRSENVFVENGLLHIVARKEDFEARQYTSARINTQNKFDQERGIFEARIKLPEGQGIWPAFWLLGSDISEVGWPNCGEIDVMEYRGQEPNKIAGTVHGPGYSAGQSIGNTYTLSEGGFDEDFHVFKMEWGINNLSFYVDDELYHQVNPSNVPGQWVFDNPFFMILNVAVGGNYVGSPDASTNFPQTMLVDYVRVYGN